MTMINSKKILAISLTAVFAVALIGSTPVASAISDLLSTHIVQNEDEIKRIRFHLAEPFAEDAFGGVAILTTGDAIAVTRHGTFFDSSSQVKPESPGLPISLSAAALCAEDDGCGNEIHAHVVKPNFDEPLCEIASVGALSFQDPAQRIIVAGNNIVLRGIDIGPQIYLESLSSMGEEFTIGAPVDLDDSTPGFDGLAFNLTPTFDGDVSAENLVVCIGPLASET